MSSSLSIHQLRLLQTTQPHPPQPLRYQPPSKTKTPLKVQSSWEFCFQMPPKRHAKRLTLDRFSTQRALAAAAIFKCNLSRSAAVELEPDLVTKLVMRRAQRDQPAEEGRGVWILETNNATLVGTHMLAHKHHTHEHERAHTPTHACRRKWIDRLRDSTQRVPSSR